MGLSESSDLRKKTESVIQNTINADGTSSETAMKVLSQLFGVLPEGYVQAYGPNIIIPAEKGEIFSAYVGACQFIFYCARLRGLPKDELERLSFGWRGRFADFLDCEDRKSFAAVIFAAIDYLRTNGGALELDFADAKPRQYYEKIYTDREAMFQHSPYALEERLTKAVIRGEREAALDILREIRRYGEKAVVAKDPVRSAKNSMIGSIAFLARATIQAGVNADNAFALSDSLIQQVELMNSKVAVLDFEESILLGFIDLVNQRLKGTYSATVTRVIHYIENNLNRRIPLADAAGYAGVHSAYLSARFKKETGFTYSGFVMLRKIQESTYFVRHTKYSVSQIAVMYGFCSQSHFITSFKKVMGITPMEFRGRFLAD